MPDGAASCQPRVDTVKATATQIIAQNPIDNSRITMSAGPTASRTVVLCANCSDRDRRTLMPRSRRRALSSAASARRLRFR